MKRDPRYRGERVYVVVWPEHMIVKAGYSSAQRWRSFMGRGASVHQLTLFGSWMPALRYEATLHRYFGARAPFAFDTREESQWLLGNLGGNCETYRLSTWAILHDMPEPPIEDRIPCPDLAYYSRPVG